MRGVAPAHALQPHHGRIRERRRPGGAGIRGVGKLAVQQQPTFGGRSEVQRDGHAGAGRIVLARPGASAIGGRQQRAVGREEPAVADIAEVAGRRGCRDVAAVRAEHAQERLAPVVRDVEAVADADDEVVRVGVLQHGGGGCLPVRQNGVLGMHGHVTPGLPEVGADGHVVARGLPQHIVGRQAGGAVVGVALGQRRR